MPPIVRSLACLAGTVVALTGCAWIPSTPLLPGENAARLRALEAEAERQNGLAQAQLGVLYFEGAPGVPVDRAAAYRWFREAAKSGCAASQLYLGLLHLSGGAVERDLDQAAYWLRLSSDQGNAAVHERLLLVHANEIPLRLRVAYEWVQDPLGLRPTPTLEEGH